MTEKKSKEQPKTDKVESPAQAVVSEESKALKTIEKITILSDLANACRDTEIVKILQSKPNGEKLYNLFVQAVSQEIESLMSGSAVSVPKSVANAQEVAQNLVGSLQRFAHLFSAIESGPTIAVLNMFLQQLGGRLPQKQGIDPSQYQQQSLPHDNGGGVEMENTGGGRRGVLGSF